MVFLNKLLTQHTTTKSDDGVQIVLRGALIPKPAPRATLRPDTLSDPGVRAAIGGLIAGTTDLTADTADALWNRVLHIGLEHQRVRAKRRGAPGARRSLPYGI